MERSQERKIKELLQKYNDVLKVSMRLAVTEDFVNLLIVNRDDRDFELRELIENKEEFSNYVMKEFLKQNSSSVAGDLKGMDEKKIKLNKNKKLIE